MINPNSLEITIAQATDNAPTKLLGVKQWYEFKDGKYTTTVVGAIYEVVALGGDYPKFTVKVPDEAPALTDDQIKGTDGDIFVEFENSRLVFYSDKNGRVQVSVKADAIKILA